MRTNIVLGAAAIAIAFATTGAPRSAAAEPQFDRAAITPKFLSRWPQPVRVGFLQGLPAVGWELARLGTIEKLIHASDGGVSVVVRYGGPFAFLGWGGRPIALPIETFGMLGRQVMILDIPPEKLDQWPTWSGSEKELGPDETVKVSLTKS